MNEYLDIIKMSPLFNGISENEIKSMLTCLSAKSETYKKNQFIFRLGETIAAVGMVLSGSVYITKEDFWGNRSILAKAEAGDLFGETFACVQTKSLGVSVTATEVSDILFLDVGRIMTTCTNVCEFHTKLMKNLLYVLADKNLMLTKKMEHMAQRTTREKLLSYLSDEAQKTGSAYFQIPFNRQQLADYLCVDRSAMSNELCKLRDEGILTFQKNEFQLKRKFEH